MARAFTKYLDLAVVVTLFVVTGFIVSPGTAAESQDAAKPQTPSEYCKRNDGINFTLSSSHGILTINNGNLTLQTATIGSGQTFHLRFHHERYGQCFYRAEHISSGCKLTLTLSSVTCTSNEEEASSFQVTNDDVGLGDLLISEVGMSMSSGEDGNVRPAPVMMAGGGFAGGAMGAAGGGELSPAMRAFLAMLRVTRVGDVGAERGRKR